jgi:hypothetical protein
MRAIKWWSTDELDQNLVRAYVCSWGCTGNGRATVKLALLTQLGNENKYYGTDQLGSAIFLAHALLPRDEI